MVHVTYNNPKGRTKQTLLNKRFEKYGDDAETVKFMYKAQWFRYGTPPVHECEIEVGRLVWLRLFEFGIKPVILNTNFLNALTFLFFKVVSSDFQGFLVGF